MPPLNSLNKTCLALAIGHSMALSANTDAAVITVNSDSDDGTGCTLREAILSANTSANQNNGCALGSDTGTDTITFANSLVSNTISLVNGELSVGATKNIEINASNITGGITIDANKTSRVLRSDTATLVLDNLTLTGGLAEQGDQVNGGAIAAYSSTLTLRNSTVSGNSVAQNGGGIFARTSTVNIYDSAISDNLSPYAYYGFTQGGGGIAADQGGSITIIDSSVSNNTAFYGSGISSRDVNLTLSNSVMMNNASNATSAADGGAIYIRGQANLSIDDSTFSGNSAPDGGAIAIGIGVTGLINSSTISGNSALRGGGIWAFNQSDVLTINNSTISGNTATFVGGGGIAIFGTEVRFNQTTLADNVAFGRGVSIQWGDGFNTGGLMLKNSLIAGAGMPLCDDSGNSIPIDIDSATIIQDGSCSAQRTGDPGLLPLADNGGPTLTHALPEDSLARNSSVGTCLLNDQRGRPRDVSDGACDVGAFEFIVEQDEPDEGSFFVVPTKNGKAVIFEL